MKLKNIGIAEVLHVTCMLLVAMQLPIIFWEYGFAQDQPDAAARTAAAAQLASEEDAPVLPDDFAKNDPPRISATWEQPAAAVAAGEFVLYTSDGTWFCGACNTQKSYLDRGSLSFGYRTVGVPSGGKSPTGSVPVWKAPDGTLLSGACSVSYLNQWAARHQPAAVASTSPDESTVVVSVDAASPAAALQALAAHVQRHSAAESAVQSWLPEIDVDVDDAVLKLLDSMLSADGLKTGGLSVKWPAGVRSVTLSPAAELRFKKIVEIDVQLTKVTVDGRKVTFALSKFPDLTVRLK